MIKTILLALTLLVIPLASGADTKTEKVARLIEAQGLLEGWSAQMEARKLASQRQGEEILNQIFANLNPNEEFKTRFAKAFNRFLAAVETPWTAEHLVEVYASFYGPHFSEPELDELINFYESALGQKDVRSTHAAVAQWSTHFSTLGEPIFKDAIDTYIAQLQIIARECNCRR